MVTFISSLMWHVHPNDNVAIWGFLKLANVHTDEGGWRLHKKISSKNG